MRGRGRGEKRRDPSTISHFWPADPPMYYIDWNVVTEPMAHFSVWKIGRAHV